MRFPKPECTKTPDRLAVEGALRNAAMAGRGLTIVEAAEATRLPVLHTPVNGPGFTPAAPVGSMPTRATTRITAASMPSADPYLAPELKTNPSILPERLEAFKLPSRIGNRLHYPCGRVEVLA